MKTKGVSFCFGRIDNKWQKYIGTLFYATVRPRTGKRNKEILDSGIRFDLVIGPMIRPVAKLYHPKFWKGNKAYNPWNSGNHWFVLKIPFVVLPFVSILFGKYSWGNPGIWIGGRTADLSNRIDWQLRLDWDKSEYDKSAWAWNEDGSPKEAWTVGEYKNQITIEPTLAIRKDSTN